jgi:hypothetical protein
MLALTPETRSLLTAHKVSRIALLVGIAIFAITPAQPCSADKKEGVANFKSAQRNLKQGDLEEAAADLARCLEATPGEERCVSMLQIVNAKRADMLIDSQVHLDPHDLPQRIALVDRAAKLNPDRERFRVLGDSLRGCFRAVEQRTRTYFDSAEATGQGFGRLPPDLEAYSPYMSSISDLRQAALVRFFDRVELDASTTHNLAGAFAEVGAIRAEGVRYPHAEHLARTAAQAIADSASRVNPLFAIQLAERALVVLPLIQQEASEGGADSLRELVMNAVGRCITAAIPASLRHSGFAEARAVRGSIVSSHPALEAIPEQAWNAALGDPHPLLVRINFAHQAECRGIPSEELAKMVTAASNGALQVSDQIATSLHLDFSDMRCDVGTRLEDVEEVQSEYIASYQQQTNPRYAELQSELAVALANAQRAAYNYAVNPNFGTSFAKGYAEGRVTKVQSVLQRTEPFTQVPIVLPYTVTRTRAVRTADVSIAVDISDALTGYRDAAWCRASAVIETIGMKGVSASDNRGLRNHDPTAELPTKQSSLEGGLSACRDSLARQLPLLFEKVLMFRLLSSSWPPIPNTSTSRLSMMSPNASGVRANGVST